MRYSKIFLFYLCLLQNFGVYSQNPVDTLRQLKVIEVLTQRLNNFSSGNKIETIDSALLNRYSSNNLADLLSNESQVFIKSYGSGSLATTSFRGAGASHTAVLWNGFNLESPLNGMLDLSLVPVYFLNDVKLQYGSAGALWGSGAVGGTIHLNNTNSCNNGISITTGTAFGSFSDEQQQMNVEISKKKFVASFKLFNHDAKNDFPFSNTAKYGKPEQKQSNAELKQYGLLQENYFQINQYQKINMRFWYQYNDRNIPPSMTQNINLSNQIDESYRVSGEWQRTKEKFIIMARAACFDEYFRFSDSLINIDAKSRSKKIVSEVESRFSTGKFDLVNVGINHGYCQATAENYLKNPEQNTTALFGSYKIHTTKNTWNVVLSGRKEFIKNKKIPFTASFGFDGNVLKFVFLKGNVARHYRLPTFNDLYYHGQGGTGNPDLKPESGWNEEIGLTLRHQYKTVSGELGTTIFNRNIGNWITWVPISSMVWTPDNVLKVWSRGVEYKLNFNYSIAKFQMQLSGLYNYVLSTNQKVTTLSDASFGKQVIYVPVQNAQGNFFISCKSIAISYTQTYVGYRYTTSDNTQYLKPYTIGNINLSKTFQLANARIKLFVQVNNIWNESYQVISYRAMPLLNFQTGLTLYLNQPNTNEL